jgi:guanine deaminase
VSKTLIKARLLTFHADPFEHADCYAYENDGVLVVEDDKILARGSADLIKDYPEARILDYSDYLLLPGFIDLHLHMPQTQVIASYGKQLLDWLTQYTFVEEAKYADSNHAEAGAEFLIETLLRHGTTSAVMFCSSHPQSVEATFAAAGRRKMRILAGKVMMDRNAPDSLLDTAQKSYEDSLDLIEKWDGIGRNHYVISPRFAITSSQAQLEAAGALAKLYPEMPIQTHLSENRAEIAQTLQLFPKARSYLEIYDQVGLVRPKALFGHAIHLEASEITRLRETGAVAVHCPTSNLFLGSGLFPMQHLRASNVAYGMASDIGAGTSYCLLQTLNEAYKIQALLGHPYSASQGFYDITLGNARRLGLEHLIGTLEPGSEADFIVLDARATPEMAHRAKTLTSLEQELFLLMILGDDRAIKATFVAGKQVK